VSTLAKTEQLLVSYKGFGSLHPWPSAQYRTYCLSALFLVRGIRRAAPAQVTACRVVTRIPCRRNSAGRQYVRYCALGQGCEDPKPLRPIRRCSQYAECSYYKQEESYVQSARAVQSTHSASTCNTTSKVQSTS